MVRQCPLFKDCVLEWLPRISGAHVIGHNLAFDKRVLFREMMNMGVDPADVWKPASEVCTLEVAREHMEGPHTLQAVAAACDVQYEKAHDAMEDAKTTHRVAAVFGARGWM